MNQDRLNELAALDAVGALDGADKQEFEMALASADAEVLANVARMKDTAAALSLVSSTPLPEDLKGRVLERIRLPVAAARRTSPFFFISASEGEWQTLPVPGVRRKELAADAKRGTSVRLYELAPGARFPHHHHSGPEECFVVSGDFHVEGRVLHAGDFHHAEEESDHDESFTVGGCQLLVMFTKSDYEN